MSKKRVLIITQEMKPYIDLTDISSIVSGLPTKLQEQDLEIRVLMPRFGSINERRHRLHEVVRLSGINVVVNDEDFPLIIKVASLPGARLQVYFLDNDDFFKRKEMFHDKKGNNFEDNAERMMFFGLGAIDIVRKFGWAPDVIHCHGWMTSLMPLLLKTQYKTEPIFENSKVVFTAYQEESFEGAIKEDFTGFVTKNTDIPADMLKPFGASTENDLNIGGLHYADAVTLGSDEFEDEVMAEFDTLDVPKLPFNNENDILIEYAKFVKELTASPVE
ncbi:MAG: starch synthase [Chitinophagales bacterium]|jgi:starch synthase